MPSGARPAEPPARLDLTYLTSFGFLINFAEALYADTGGFFARNGLNVQILPGRGSAGSVQQVSAGNVMISRTGGTDLMKACAKDPEVIAIGEIYRRDLYYVISRAERPVRSPEDFPGRTAGIISPGGSTENLLDMMLVQAGLRREAVTRQVTGDSAGAFEVLRQGRVDFLFLTRNNLEMLQRRKAPVVAWSTDEAVRAPAQVYISSRRTIARHGERLGRFLRGIHDAIGDLLAQADLNRVLNSIQTKYELAGASGPDHGLAELQSSLAAFRVAWQGRFVPEPQSWQSAFELMIRAGILPAGPQPSFFTPEILHRAFG